MEVRDLKTNKWIDSSVFRREAINFQQNNTFCTAPDESPDWFEYWNEQLKRCKEGFSVIDGEGRIHKVTGNHYMYLNFSQLESVIKVKGSKASRKVVIQPDFWDGDYDYFWSVEIARFGLFGPDSQVPSTDEEFEDYIRITEEITELKVLIETWSTDKSYLELKKELDLLNQQVLKRLGLKVVPHPDYLDGGYHMVIGKSRRKGYSFKNAAICANAFNTIRNSQVIIGAADKKFLFPKGTMGMASSVLNFINKHTAWRKTRDYVDKQDHKKASFKKFVEGTPVESGYMSEMFALTFRDNPDAARGKDGYIVLLEEAGAFPNLKASFAAIKPALTAGTYITGQILIFGTGGDMESGTVDFADMFYSPEAYDMMPFVNIWDEEAENSVCGFFHPVIWNMEGCYDEQGNSDIEKATKFEMSRRDKIMKSSSSLDTLNKHTQEFPFSPSEAFLAVSTNNFPVVALRRQLMKVVANKWQEKKGFKTLFKYDDGTVKLDVHGARDRECITRLNKLPSDTRGCPMIYEVPIEDAPKGLYKVGYDPVSQDEGTSLAAIIVYKGVHVGGFQHSVIVAEYIGRLQTTEDIDALALQFAEYYNTTVMYENMVIAFKNFARRKKKLHLVALQPNTVISKNVKKSRTARVYGCHMSTELKDAGERYVKDWLLMELDYDENGDPITVIDKIYSIRLLEELIYYSRKGNFDLVSSLFMCMFQVQESVLDKTYDTDPNKKTKMQMMMEFLDKKLYK